MTSSHSGTDLSGRVGMHRRINSHWVTTYSFAGQGIISNYFFVYEK